MKTLIIGYGEVGKALFSILSEHYAVDFLDYHQSKLILSREFEPDIIHICFPYSDKFIQYAKEYQEKYKPKFTVIHSTTPVGTSAKLSAIHSPIRGIHPNLEEGIKIFPKFIGGKQGSDVADYFRKCGIRIVLFDKSETTEAMKLWDTEYYKRCIEFAKEVKQYCDEHNLNFHEVYTIPNQTYGEAYTKLGYPEFVRPVLQPIMTPIGGHCVEPNHKILYGEETKDNS